MAIELTQEALQKIFPKATPAIIAAFLAKQDVLTKAGINHTRNRLAYAFAQVEHESSGLTRLRENINYTPERAAQIWPYHPSRPQRTFHSGDDCLAKVGSWRGDPEFRIKLIDLVYGGRMGNRPGTHDGSNNIGRGGPQLTGRDAYVNVDKHAGLGGRLAANPALAETAELQPDLIAGFVNWKGLNAKADLGQFGAYVKGWNGGLIGMADREHQLAGNDPFIARLKVVDAIKPIAKDLPGKPPTKDPPKAAIDAATTKERAARAGGVASGSAGGAGEAARAGTQQPDKPAPAPAILSPLVTYTLIGLGIAVFIVAAVLIARKVKIVKANWN